jgi:hypothetical protein
MPFDAKSAGEKVQYPLTVDPFCKVGRLLFSGLLASLFSCTTSGVSAFDAGLGPFDAGTVSEPLVDAGPPNEPFDAGVAPDASIEDAGTPICNSGALTPGAVLPAFNLRPSQPVMTRTSYDYAPSVMFENGVFRMWWCGGIAGDHILHAQAASLAGPWHSKSSQTPNTFDDVFAPTGNANTFDGQQTCDPSVLKIGATYYLYYGGFPQPGALPQTTAFGVAESSDGYTFTRAHGGTPIASPARNFLSVPNAYGAGQPSAVVLGDFVYVFFTDSTAQGSNAINGGGQFVFRSKDPTFVTGVEELFDTGFRPFSEARTRLYSVVGAFSVDVAYSDGAQMFVIATNGRPQILDIRFYAPGFPPTPVGQPNPWIAASQAPGAWTEGPGLVRDTQGHFLPQANCATLGIDIVRSTGTAGVPNTYDLAWQGWDVATGLNCPCRR